MDDVDFLLGAVHGPAALLQVVVEPVSCIRRGEVDEGVAEVAPTPAISSTSVTSQSHIESRSFIAIELVRNGKANKHEFISWFACIVLLLDKK